MGIARWGLVLLIFAVAFVFFGSVICPPLDEREAEQEQAEVQYPLQEDPGTYKPLPGEVQIEDRFPTQREEVEVTPIDRDREVKLRILDQAGSPISGADLVVALQAEKGNPLVQNVRSDEDGFAQVRKVPPSVQWFHAIVSHDDFFDAEFGPTEMPADSAGTFVVMMVPAAYVRGVVLALDLKPVVFGMVQLAPLDGTEAMQFTIDPEGIFQSPKVLPGDYRLSWSGSPSDVVPAALQYSMSLTAGQKRTFQINVDTGRSKDGDLEVGILEIPQ